MTVLSLANLNRSEPALMRLSEEARVEPILIPKVGLQLPRQMAFEKWLTIGRQLSEVCTSSSWCLGDWLVYGEDTYGSRYRDAIEYTSLDYQTLRNYAWVARRFSLSRRRYTLSFGHHSEVAALSDPEQEFWLRKAEELGWSCKRLRSEVRASLREREDSDPCEMDTTSSEKWPQQNDELKVELSPDQIRSCEQAAGKAGLSIEAWAIQALDRAARHCMQAID